MMHDRPRNIIQSASNDFAMHLSVAYHSLCSTLLSSRWSSTKSCPLLMFVLTWSLTLLLISSCVGLDADTTTHSDQPKRYLECKENSSILARLDSICEGCYNISQDARVEILCRQKCFTTDNFKTCLDKLNQTDPRIEAPDTTTHSDQPKRYLECKENSSILARLDSICEGCYNISQDARVEILCRQKCFTTDNFKTCLDKLNQTDPRIEAPDTTTHSDQPKRYLECKENSSILARLDSICEGCYNISQDARVEILCRQKCFTTDNFKTCLDKLNQTDPRIEAPDTTTHSDQPKRYLECKENSSILARLDSICEGCYNISQDARVEILCRQKCFTTDNFKTCLDKLNQTDPRIEALCPGPSDRYLPISLLQTSYIPLPCKNETSNTTKL